MVSCAPRKACEIITVCAILHWQRTARFRWTAHWRSASARCWWRKCCSLARPIYRGGCPKPNCEPTLRLNMKTRLFFFHRETIIHWAILFNLIHVLLTFDADCTNNCEQIEVEASVEASVDRKWNWDFALDQLRMFLIFRQTLHVFKPVRVTSTIKGRVTMTSSSVTWRHLKRCSFQRSIST